MLSLRSELNLSCETMSATSGNYSDSLDRNSEGTPCRLCMKKNDYYYNIFTSIVASQITVEDALHDLVDLKVAVGDGLPATLCPLCLKKLIEFYDFRNICHESDAELRNVSSRNYFRSIHGEGTADDDLGSSAETQDCIPDATRGTSRFACSVQATEIYIPLPDSQGSRANMLMNGNHLGEGDYAVLNKPDPAQMSSDVSDPLAIDDVCHVKEENKDHFGEESYRVLHTPDPVGNSRDASDPLETDVLPQESTSSQGEVVDAEGTGAFVIDLDCLLVRAKKEPSPEENDATESGIKTGSPSAKADLSSDDEGQDVHNDSTDGTTNELPPQASDQTHIWSQASTSSQCEEVDSEGTGAIGIDLDSMPVLANKESPKETDATEPTFMENGELIQKHTTTMESMTEALDLPAQETAAALFGFLEPKIISSHSRKGWKVMDKDIKKYGTGVADKITSCSIPDDGQFHSKSKRMSKIRGGKETMNVTGETSGCDNSDTIKFFKVTNSGNSGHEAAMWENKKISAGMIKNPGKRSKSKDNCYICFNCGDAFNAQHDLIKHLKIHLGSDNLDIDADLSIGKNMSLKTLVSKRETDSSHQPTSSKSLKKLICKRQEVRQEGNGLFKANFGGTTEKKNVRELRRSSIVDGKSGTYSPHTAKKPYSCSECEKSFSQKSNLVRHIRTHTKEKPYSCGECEKSFSQKFHLIYHIRTHTKEKPYFCGECEKSFSRKSNLVCHIRTHTKEKPYSCGECEKSFSVKTSLIDHILTHTKTEPYSCGECEKSFSAKRSLVRHIRTHTKAKPYSCGECEKSFSQKCHLVLHIRTHTKEKPYSCGECDKSFSQKSNLVRHIRTHTKEKRYSRGDGERSFSVRRSHVCHLQTHTEEKSYSCNECEKFYGTKRNLVLHMRVHRKKALFLH